MLVTVMILNSILIKDIPKRHVGLCERYGAYASGADELINKTISSNLSKALSKASEGNTC